MTEILTVEEVLEQYGKKFGMQFVRFDKNIKSSVVWHCNSILSDVQEKEFISLISPYLNGIGIYGHIPALNEFIVYTSGLKVAS